MTEKEIKTSYFVYDNLEELEEADQSLMQKACGIRDKAYAPYSKFMVGAAIHLANGEIITGNNQENAAYPSGLCAERNAIFQAGAQFPNEKILTIAISVKSQNKKVIVPAPPCGACRQAIAEYEFKQESPIKIMFMAEIGKVIQVNSLLDILPLAFDSSYL
ncbi:MULTISPECIES: cytidine deaminase [Mesonia]|uniref:Cytidine deaminase n=1 Tax=Mesonia oceanica TaxID=2687242 RepID=A0AC61Y5M7_9FLAO|nr:MULTISPECIES: cytidine deaminase [Mesonia]MAN28924.1 cytidine deaminase [Mesonia sp.]MAQ42705.1 cytidine deaminase [Mesonia sp.]MBJ99242.1 cytidine deaminase [Flavobacteriaceae bacterium]VVU99759.1 Cytidine deaminase [Mesonia oceanica]|tara:strand:- start:72141 stop:72623 length:483 start_codon:yes stop_codon:yes gene_type:complete